MSESIAGRISSIETCGTVDGPGVRFVAFAQGCALRCLYCHNPETRDPREGRVWTAEDLFREILRYRNFQRFSGGGFTFSGGEPLMQPRFTAEVFRLCREAGIHTTLDTSGYCDVERVRGVLEKTDLVLLDVKSFDPTLYRRLTGVSLEPTLRLALELDRLRIPTWIRFVLIPGLTDEPGNLQGLADFVSGLGNVQRVEVLPFHQMARAKWERLGLRYELGQVPPATPEQVNAATEFFRRAGMAAA